MPNWCYNQIEIEGPAESIAKLEKLITTEQSKFDFNAIIPMPEELRKVKSGGNKINGKQVTRWWEDEEGNKTEIPEETLNEWQEKYGATDWYDWACKNWGTKWNNTDNVEVQGDTKEGWLSYEFDTAWSPPIPVLSALSEKFPDCRIEIHYNEEGNGFSGCEVFEAG